MSLGTAADLRVIFPPPTAPVPQDWNAPVTHRWARVLHGALGAAAFAAGLALIWTLLNGLVAPTPADGITKVEWLREHGASFDTLFVGSSLTARQVAPAVFDATMEELGLPTRSFNLALPGMLPPEDGYVLERALNDREAPLRFVLVECQPLRFGIRRRDHFTSRAVYWHDTARMRALWNRFWALPSRAGEGAAEPLSPEREIRHLRRHAEHWLWNTTRMGRGAEGLKQALASPKDRVRAQEREARELGPDGDGYRPAEADALAGAALASYAADLAVARGRGSKRVYGDPESQQELLRKRALVESHGARMVLVAPPALGPQLAPLPESGLLFLDFADPDRFPELFAPEHRKDRGHLNQEGAAIYSRLLAHRLAEAVRAPDAVAAQP